MQHIYSAVAPWRRAEIKQRLDGNIFTYVGNYLAVIFAIFCCVLYNRPLALLGLIVTVKMWDWVRMSGDPQVGPLCSQRTEISGIFCNCITHTRMTLLSVR